MAGFDPMKKMGKMLNAVKKNAPKLDDSRENGNRGRYNGGYRGNGGNRPSYSSQPPTKIHGVDPAPIGEPFYNPYTFIPFPSSVARGKVSYLTADEREKERFTGVLKLKVKTLAPLMTCEALPYEGDKDTHKKYHALTIGKDVIVPATSVRGSLRTLMTILAGGTLGYMDSHMWLCQGRDLQLGMGPLSATKTCLARIVEVGNQNHDGVVVLGETRLILTENLKNLYCKNGLNFDDECESFNKNRAKQVFTDVDLTKLSFEFSEETPWMVRISGPKIKPQPANVQSDEVPEDSLKKALALCSPDSEMREIWVDDIENPTSISPVQDHVHSRYFLQNTRNGYVWKKAGRPHDAVFLEKEKARLILKKELWADYQGRHKTSSRPELKDGDLVWLELAPEKSSDDDISAEDVISIQWARWGRKGQLLKDALPKCVVPDNLRSDDLVDSVTDLWGQVPMEESKVGAFAARIKPHNLVFENASLEEKVTLAPMAQPHPGCLPFYRNGKADSISINDSLNGYKVYRNTTARGNMAPWLFSVQGIYDRDACNMISQYQKLNKTVDLLSENQIGNLKISLRSLSKKELALLLLVCTVDWKLGGGKPFGLGHCRVIGAELVNEMGESVLNLESSADVPLQLPNEYAELVTNFDRRVEFYKKSQEPVELLRYPRAVSSDNGGLHREGLRWFARHSSVKRQNEGLEQLIVGDSSYNGLVLGNIEVNAGPLYGYDMICKNQFKHGGKKQFGSIKKFDPSVDKSDAWANRGKNKSWNKDDRHENRGRRTY